MNRPSDDGLEAVEATLSGEASAAAISGPPHVRIVGLGPEGTGPIAQWGARGTSLALLEGDPVDVRPGGANYVRAITTDGTGAVWVVCNAEDPRRLDLWRWTRDEARRVIEGDRSTEFLSVSANGRWIVARRLSMARVARLYLFDTSEVEPVAREIGRWREDELHNAVWVGVDGQTVAVLDGRSEFTLLMRLDSDGGETTLWEPGATIEEIVPVDGSGERYLAALNRNAATDLVVVDVGGAQATTRLVGGGLPTGRVLEVAVAQKAPVAAVLLETDSTPAELYAIDLESGRGHRILGDDRPRGAYTPVTPEHATFEARDGLGVPMLVYRPREATASSPVPIVIHVHGGPGGQSRRAFDPVIQWLVAHGYGVIAVNHRGSSGYGKTFFAMDDRQHGTADLADLLDAREHVRTLEWAMPERVGIMGGSYGGYLVCAAMAFHPGTFACGIDAFGVTNWERVLQSVPPSQAVYRRALHREMGSPVTDAARHRAMSPLFKADRVRDPMLVVQGALDTQVPQVESDQFVAALRENGVPVDYLVFEDEGHGFKDPANRLEAARAYVRFLDAHLKR